MDKPEKTLFPKVDKAIRKLIEDEEGGIVTSKVLLIGTMIIVLGQIFGMDFLNGHKSHSSHTSHSSTSYHRSHVSHTSHTSSSHSSHGSHSNHSSHSNRSHSNHSSHASHSSHTSHSNTASHSNSNYSAAGDYNTPQAPEASSITGPNPPTVMDTTVELPNVQTATLTPEASMINLGEVIVPGIQIPQDTPSIIPELYHISDLPKTPSVSVDDDIK